MCGASYEGSDLPENYMCHPVVFHLDLNRLKPDIQVLWVLGLV